MIGVYGGTFNPVHYGHLRTALEVRELFELTQLNLIPCRLPPHRNQPEVEPEQRMQMLELAIAGVPEFRADRCELDRSGPSYMVDTLRSLREENASASLLMFVGSDAFAGLERWQRWQALFDYAHVVVMTRPGYALPAMGEFLCNRICRDKTLLRTRKSGLLYFQPVTALDIAATAIRALIASGRNPKFLLPDNVIAYIRQQGLYLSSNQDSECKQKNY